MAVTLQDPTRQRDPSSGHAFPDIVGEADLRARRTLAEELLAELQPENDEHTPHGAVEAADATTVAALAP
jgi:hypothetical protein